MMRCVMFFSVSAVMLFLSGCAAAAVAKFEKEQAQYMEKAIETAIERASFDMGCNDVDGRLLGDIFNSTVKMDVGVTVTGGDTPLQTTVSSKPAVEMTIGVTGCGKRATYLVRCQPITERAIPGHRCISRLDAFSE